MPFFVPALYLAGAAAVALFASGCATHSGKTTKANSPQDKYPLPDPGPPDATKVQALENLTLEDFERNLFDRPGKQEALRELAQIISGGNPKLVDPGAETKHVATLLGRNSLSYPHLLPFNRITIIDIFHYGREHNKKELENREKIKQGFQISSIQHPFVKIVDHMPISQIDEFRGLPAFQDLAKVLLEKIPEVKTSRNLQVLYPGSGSHVAPLFTAIKLIDQGIIDQATYTYTELEGAKLGDLAKVLQYGATLNIFDRLTLNKGVDFPDGGSESVIEILYKGKPIRIIYALNRSGKDYYRREYFERADLIILHDPGRGDVISSFSLLADFLLNKKASPFSQKNQLVIMEGIPDKSDPKAPPGAVSTFPKAMGQTSIPGPYGHCFPLFDLGEIGKCNSNFARVFLFNDPALQNLVNQSSNSRDLIMKLYNFSFSP